MPKWQRFTIAITTTALILAVSATAVMACRATTTRIGGPVPTKVDHLAQGADGLRMPYVTKNSHNVR